MKRKMFQKLMAASLATVMAVGLVGCGAKTPANGSQEGSQSSETPADSSTAEGEGEGEVPEYTVLKDANGNVYDLGGVEIIIRDWWSDPEGKETAPRNEYEEARKAYRDWCMETYNFKLTNRGISDWGSAPKDFQDYVTTGGDDNYYLFTLREDPATTAALDNGLMYDLSTLDCLDFSEKKFTDNNVHKTMSRGSFIGTMVTGMLEPRDGVYFNKRLLQEAGVNPDDLYTWQENGEWTWAKFEELLEKVQRDVDGDGTIDIWGYTGNTDAMWKWATYSNGGEWVGKDDTGHYVYKLEDPEALEALNWFVEIVHKYEMPKPQDATQWDWFKAEWAAGRAVFAPDEAYMAGPNGSWGGDAVKDEFGFVCFPKGPKASGYVNVAAPNPLAIPACYDAEKAWKIAFAYNLFSDPVPGWEDYEGWTIEYMSYAFDLKAQELTIPRLLDNIVHSYDGQIQNLVTGEGFAWAMAGDGVAACVERVRDAWKSYIDATNARVDSNNAQ